MIEDTIKHIIGFIKSNIGLEREDIEERANREIKNIVKRFFRQSILDISKNESKEFLNLITELREIREVYQKGKSFVKNQEKGKKKGSPRIIYTILKHYIREGKTEKAKKEALKHLEYTMKAKSERTYYRHLKKIRELGIEI